MLLFPIGFFYACFMVASKRIAAVAVSYTHLEEDLQRLRGLRLIDDDFMAAVFEERACAEFLLQDVYKRQE